MDCSKLIIIEGFLENRKRTIEAMIVSQLQERGEKVVCVGEAMFQHPASHDIPQFEAEREQILAKWRELVEHAEAGTTYVCNCIFLRDSMRQAIMHADMSTEDSCRYLCEIADIIHSMNPMILYIEQKEKEEYEKREECMFEKAGLDFIALGETLTAEEFRSLFLSVGWSAPAIEQIQTALKHTTKSYVARKRGQAVGMINLQGDFGMHWLIKDVIVHPDYQGKMIGTVLYYFVEEYIRSTLSDGWKVDVSVFSSPIGERFYTHLGFQTCPRRYMGSGMDKVIESV